jgi:hypothetical protein
MKFLIASFAIAALTIAPVAFGGSGHDREYGPCFQVNIQNDRVNESRVEQSCDQNFSRTVQAGTENSAQTKQTGRVNDNKVRQYHYDTSRFFGPIRSR